MSIEVIAGQYARLRAEIKLKEAELKALKDQEAGLEQSLIDQFSTSGIGKITINDTLIYTQKTTRASYDCSTPQAQAALRDANLAFMLKLSVNAQTFTSWVIEQKKLGYEVPSNVAQYAKINEYREVRAKKA